MSNNLTKNDFSISGHLAFNPEDNCNYVVVENSRGKIKTLNSDVPSLSSSRVIVKSKHQNNEQPFNFVKLKRVTKDAESTPSSARSAITPTNENILKDHDYLDSPTAFVKLRNTENTPRRVKSE